MKNKEFIKIIEKNIELDKMLNKNNIYTIINTLNTEKIIEKYTDEEKFIEIDYNNTKNKSSKYDYSDDYDYDDYKEYYKYYDTTKEKKSKTTSSPKEIKKTLNVLIGFYDEKSKLISFDKENFYDIFNKCFTFDNNVFKSRDELIFDNIDSFILALKTCKDKISKEEFSKIFEVLILNKKLNQEALDFFIENSAFDYYSKHLNLTLPMMMVKFEYVFNNNNVVLSEDQWDSIIKGSNPNQELKDGICYNLLSYLLSNYSKQYEIIKEETLDYLINKTKTLDLSTESSFHNGFGLIKYFYNNEAKNLKISKDSMELLFEKSQRLYKKEMKYPLDFVLSFLNAITDSKFDLDHSLIQKVITNIGFNSFNLNTKNAEVFKQVMPILYYFSNKEDIMFNKTIDFLGIIRGENSFLDKQNVVDFLRDTKLMNLVLEDQELISHLIINERSFKCLNENELIKVLKTSHSNELLYKIIKQKPKVIPFLNEETLNNIDFCLFILKEDISNFVFVGKHLKEYLLLEENNAIEILSENSISDNNNLFSFFKQNKNKKTQEKIDVIVNNSIKRRVNISETTYFLNSLDDNVKNSFNIDLLIDKLKTLSVGLDSLNDYDNSSFKKNIEVNLIPILKNYMILSDKNKKEIENIVSLSINKINETLDVLIEKINEDAKLKILKEVAVLSFIDLKDTVRKIDEQKNLKPK